VGWTAVAWVLFVTVLFFAPPFWPFWPPTGRSIFGTGADAVTVFHSSNVNFTGPIVLALFAVVGIWWVVSARRWFTGPQVQGTPSELLALERALDAVDTDADTAEALEDAADARVTHRSRRGRPR
jgi:hypothetical protein